MSMRPVTEDDLQAYVDRALDAARQSEVEAYLAEHPKIAARVEGYVGQRDALRAALRPTAEEPLPSALNLARMIDVRSRRGSAPWWSAAAAAVFLCLGLAGGWSLRDAVEARPSGGIASLVAEAADTYAVFSPDDTRPVEMRAAEKAELLRWVSLRVGHAVQAPDLSSVGYRLMGGRLVATAHGPAAMLMYDDDKGTRLVLLSRPMAVDRDAAISEHAHGAIAGLAWSNRGIGYSLVATAPRQTLWPLAEEIRRQVGTAA